MVGCEPYRSKCPVSSKGWSIGFLIRRLLVRLQHGMLWSLITTQQRDIQLDAKDFDIIEQEIDEKSHE